jgi:DNA polymerase
MGILNLRQIDKDYKSNLQKDFLYPYCTSSNCPRYNDPCPMIKTEVIRVANYPEIDLFIIGQGAGKIESITKQPFSGPSGKYLRDIINYLWTNGKLFNIVLTNNVRCHPVNDNGSDRPPNQIEINNCIDFTLNEIEKFNPKVIVAVGKNATKSILKNHDDTKLMKDLRGTYNIYLKGFIRKVYVTYHPSYLLRQYNKFDEYNLQKFDKIVINDFIKALELCS